MDADERNELFLGRIHDLIRVDPPPTPEAFRRDCDALLAEVAEAGARGDELVAYRDAVFFHRLVLASPKAWNWPIEEARRTFEEWSAETSERYPEPYFSAVVNYADSLVAWGEPSEALAVLRHLERVLRALPAGWKDSMGFDAELLLTRVEEQIDAILDGSASGATEPGDPADA